MIALANLPGVVSHEDASDGDLKRLRLTFTNGYTASIIQGPHSYGGVEGLFEVAVMHNEQLVYDTPVTDDVIGRLHSEEVPEVLMQIAALPPRVGS
jgi:hypothetical protein